MEKSKNTTEKLKPYRETPFFCSNCGPFIKVYIENWMSGSYRMSHIDFIHHIDCEPYLAYRLQIEKPSDGQIYSIIHCADCGMILKSGEIKHKQWNKLFKSR